MNISAAIGKKKLDRSNVKDACVLIDAGFEYVTGDYDDGGKIFRKPKDYIS